MFGMFITFLGVTKSIRKKLIYSKQNANDFPTQNGKCQLYIYFTKRYQTRAKN
jgi:hypothetical protein